MDIFKLVGRVMVDSRDAQDSIAKTDSKALGMAKTLGKGIITAAKWGAALAGAAVAAGTAVFAAASKVAEAGDEIDKGSQKLQVTAEQYQKLAFAAERSGTSIDTLAVANKTLQKSDFSGNLYDAVKSVASISDASERAAKAVELFGSKAGQEMLPLLNAGAEGVQELFDQVDKLGGLMSNEAVTASAKYQDSLTNLKYAFSGFKNRLMSGFLPGMTKVMDGVALIISGNMEDGKESVEDGIDAIVTTMHEMAPQVMGVIEMVLKILVDNIPMLIDMGLKLAKSLLSTLFDPENVYKMVNSAVDMLLTMGETLSDSMQNGDVLAAFWDVGKAIAKAIWDGVKKHFKINRDKFYAEQEENYGINSLFSQIRSDGKHASGLNYVPYDGYVAELHRGEMVVPANKANEARNSSDSDKIEYLLKQIFDCLKSSQTININNREFGRLVRGVT